MSALAARHATEITFDEYLERLGRIAVAAGEDADALHATARVLGGIVTGLGQLAEALAADDALDARIVARITALAESAEAMRVVGARAGGEFDVAAQGAADTAAHVVRVYGADMQATRDQGLAHASAASHHD